MGKVAEKTERQLKAEQKQLERLQKAKEEKARVQNMTSRGVPKPKNPTTLAALDKQDDSKQEDNSGSLLGVGLGSGIFDGNFQGNDQLDEDESPVDKYYKPPVATATSGIGKGTASITDVKARQHQRLGITPAPAYPAASRSQPGVVGYF